MSTSFVFATLTPENAAAQKCLASLVEKHPQLPGVRINPAAAISTDRAAQSRYQLVLSLDTNSGSGYSDGWVVGKRGAKSASVDLPIGSTRSRLLEGTTVCRIWIHPRSGVLMLYNTNEHHPIIYLQADGNTDIELQYLDMCVLHMTTNHLRIGPLDFVLSFAVEDESAYAAARNTYMRKWYQQWDLEGGGGRGHGRLDVLPRPEHQRMRNIILHHIISKGAFGVVIAGVDRQSGDPIACKIIHCRDYDSDIVNNEIDIASRIPAQTIGLMPLKSWWCEHGQSPPCFQFAFETVYLVMPYAPWSFDTIAWRGMPPNTRLLLFRQVLEGLRNLHARSIMHRDISPRNLLVLSQEPPRAAICDYGKAKVGIRGRLAALGPPAFAAPEVGTPEGHTSAIDIFSLGLSMLATFGPQGWTGPMSSRENHHQALEHVIALQDSMPDGLGALLRSMLAWDPAGRPTAEQALEDPVWEQITMAAAVGPGPAAAEARGDGDSSSGHSPGGGGGSTAARLRRSGGMSPSGSDRVNRKRRPEPAGSDSSKEKRTRTQLLESRSLLSPPPA